MFATAALGLMTIAVLYIASHPGLVSTAHANSTLADEKDLDRSRCSDHTLRGRYAVRGEGWVPNGPPGSPMVPFADVSLMTLDGDGNLTNDITVSRNGQISQNIDTGTYSVGNNCKGTMTINIATPPFQLTFDLVVADGGKEFIFIATTPSVVNHVAKSLN
jgi:hypothetical protein